MGQEISKRYSCCSFHQPNFMRALATMVEYRLLLHVLLYLTIGQIKKKCGTLKF